VASAPFPTTTTTTTGWRSTSVKFPFAPSGPPFHDACQVGRVG
jgi:hypothetical protein